MSDQQKEFKVKDSYVLGFMFDVENNKVLLIWKNRPDWQKDKLNGIGGKIEKDETPLRAMEREFREETFFQVGYKFNFDTDQEEMLVPHWRLVGTRGRFATFDDEPGSYKMYIFGCFFQTGMCDWKNGAERNRPHLRSQWKIPFNYPDPNHEEIINLPMNMEMIHRKGVPGLVWTLDATLQSLREGFMFHVVDRSTV